ncbi:unnamed protein product [Caenorhabditis auriculariae]|uniref:C-type lectin domain-containing protein n=1 Tax=Caenorhabditis auriculariae TaxID=2777116 RepID=A0A8S1HTR5_9PELO|nr:unnamed protein product [Caenorhabditis auriculariae]
MRFFAFFLGVAFAQTQHPGCPIGQYVFENVCYVFVREPSDFDEAVTKCGTDGRALVTITNAFQSNFLMSVAEVEFSETNDRYWIGLRRTTDGFEWIDGNAKPTYTNWQMGQPDDFGNCTSVQGGTGRWHSEDCSHSYSYICSGDTPTTRASRASTNAPTSTRKDPTVSHVDPGPCRANWTHFQNDCYFLVRSEVIWNDAQAYCRSYNSNLTSILNEDENEFIVALASQGQLDQNWNDQGNLDWSEGWSEGEPLLGGWKLSPIHLFFSQKGGRPCGSDCRYFIVPDGVQGDDLANWFYTDPTDVQSSYICKKSPLI